MAKALPSQSLAIRICKAVHDLKGTEFHWSGIDEVCAQMKVKRTDEIDEALVFASENSWLDCSPPPTHSVLLTHKGALAIRGKAKGK
jgi:hypothetical protein